MASKKTILFFLALLSGSFAVAMEKDVILSIEGRDVAIPVHHAQRMGIIRSFLEDCKTEGAFPLPNVTLADWEYIEECLNRLKRIQDLPSYKEYKIPQRQRKLVEYLEAVPLQCLVSLYWAINYLNIQELKEFVLKAFKSNKLVGDVDTLMLLPAEESNSIIFYKLVALGQPLVPKEYAVYHDRLDAFSSLCPGLDGGIVLGTREGMIRVLDMQGKLVRMWEAHKGVVSNVCQLQRGLIVSASVDDGSICVWRLKDLQAVWLLASFGTGKVVDWVHGAIDSGKYCTEFWEMPDGRICVHMLNGTRYGLSPEKNEFTFLGNYENKRSSCMEISSCRGAPVLPTENLKDASYKFIYLDDNIVEFFEHEAGNRLLVKHHTRCDSSFSILDNDLVTVMKAKEYEKEQPHLVCSTDKGMIVTGSADTIRFHDLSLYNLILQADDAQAKRLLTFMKMKRIEEKYLRSKFGLSWNANTGYTDSETFWQQVGCSLRDEKFKMYVINCEIEGESVFVPIAYQKHVGIFSDSGVGQQPLCLEIKLSDWEFISKQLDRLMKVESGYLKESTKTLQKITDSFNKLDSKQLVSICNALEYLNIPSLQEYAVNTLKQIKCSCLDEEELKDNQEF